MSAPVSLSEVMSAARRNRAPIGPESAGYIALAIADALARAPRAADAASCSLAEDGSVLVVEGNKAVQRAVMLGTRGDAYFGSAPEAALEIASGLAAGGAVLRGSVGTLRDGTPVHVATPASSAH